jgi:hypothetical protein
VALELGGDGGGIGDDGAMGDDGTVSGGWTAADPQAEVARMTEIPTNASLICDPISSKVEIGDRSTLRLSARSSTRSSRPSLRLRWALLTSQVTPGAQREVPDSAAGECWSAWCLASGKIGEETPQIQISTSTRPSARADVDGRRPGGFLVDVYLY